MRTGQRKKRDRKIRDRKIRDRKIRREKEDLGILKKRGGR